MTDKRRVMNKRATMDASRETRRSRKRSALNDALNLNIPLLYYIHREYSFKYILNKTYGNSKAMPTLTIYKRFKIDRTVQLIKDSPSPYILFDVTT